MARTVIDQFSPLIEPCSDQAVPDAEAASGTALACPGQDWAITGTRFPLAEVSNREGRTTWPLHYITPQKSPSIPGASNVGHPSGVPLCGAAIRGAGSSLGPFGRGGFASPGSVRASSEQNTPPPVGAIGLSSWTTYRWLHRPLSRAVIAWTMSPAASCSLAAFESADRMAPNRSSAKACGET